MCNGRLRTPWSAAGLSAWVALVCLWCAGVKTVEASHLRDQVPAQGTASAPGDPGAGKELFVANCSRCHGLDATGAEGPSIQGAPEKLGDEGVTRAVKNGIAGTGMPAFTLLSDREIASILAYIRSLLKLAGSTAASAGDPRKGQALYQEEKCADCHIIHGQGESFGPELSEIGSLRTTDALRAALVSPGAELPRTKPNRDRGKWTQYLVFRAVTKDGQTVEGMRVADDSFATVLEDAQGRFHSIAKTDVVRLEKENGKSFMPAFGGKLSPAQLDDLTSYLSSLKGSQ
jgi:putative heme-binding domain-containing protein